MSGNVSRFQEMILTVDDGQNQITNPPHTPPESFKMIPGGLDVGPLERNPHVFDTQIRSNEKQPLVISVLGGALH